VVIDCFVKFVAPNRYRWKEFGTRDGKEDSTLYHEEVGTYTVEGNQLIFTPDNGDPWTATFEIPEATGNLLITKPDGETWEFEYERTHWG